MSKQKYNLNLIFELSHIFRDVFVRDFLADYPAPEGLNRTHLRTMLFILFANNPKMSEISGNMGLEKGSFTPVAQKLLNLGYISKSKTDKDRRKSILNLTDKGKQLTTEYYNAHAKYIYDKLELLGDDQEKYMELLASFLELTKKMK
ncbi:MAG: MarR family transcriptional regulator [Clostridia bacterium]|nr:MarR family transcriptional regulator [Clostridia bacterium]